jgi:PhzF family phenazine biosynthesis protein
LGSGKGHYKANEYIFILFRSDSLMFPLPLLQIDAFTSIPFKGNPAAVCFLDAPRPDDWMQAVAIEMNLSETAFLLPEKDGYRLRWFTPGGEVDLCGHATLASSHALYETGRLKLEETAQFYTRSGLLTARQENGWIALNFPVTLVKPVEPPPGLLPALGIKPCFVGKSQFDFFIELTSEDEVTSLKPDFYALKNLSTRGVIVTSTSAKYDFTSRFFAPGLGIDEDPVTGSAHCALAPYWAEKLGKRHFNAYQASRRGGILKVTLDGERVLLSGQAVTVMSAQLLV